VNFDGKTFNVSATFAGGYNLTWSPDGTVLAFVEREKTELGNVQGFSFFVGGSVQTLSLSSALTEGPNEEIIPYAVFPLGWVDAPMK
jgi:Tol biopolymer transport system component